jgi:hypothetical protein
LTDQPLVTKKKKICGTISFTLEYSNAPAFPRLLSSKAEEDVNNPAMSSDKIQSVTGPLSSAGKAGEGITNAYETWQPLLDKIKAVVKIASTIAGVMAFLSYLKVSLITDSTNSFTRTVEWSCPSSLQRFRFVSKTR